MSLAPSLKCNQRPTDASTAWRESDTSDIDIKTAAHASSSSSSGSNTDSDSDSDSDASSSHRRITNSKHAKLSAELRSFVHIPAPLSDLSSDNDSDTEGPRPPKGSSTIASSIFTSKHELENPPVPPVEIEEIGPEETMEPVGVIMSVVGPAVIVQADAHGSQRVLDTGSLLCFADRRVLGAVFEAFGPVMKPMYIVRFSSSSEVTSNALITPGARVFFVPGRSTFLFTSALRAMKGSDASNVYDEEVDEREREFSDDEEERAHKKVLEVM